MTTSTGRSRPRASILVTGTELVTGAIRDENGPWLAAELDRLGFEVAQVHCVGDRPDDLVVALRVALDRGTRLVVTSGGLGPTADDATVAAVAEVAELPLVLDEAMHETISAIIADYVRRTGFGGEAMDAATRKQAIIPQGAATLHPAGTAPGLVVQHRSGAVIVVLPGPPHECHRVWQRALDNPSLRTILDETPAATASSLRFYGLPESEISQSLRDVADQFDLEALEVVTCLRHSELEVDIRPAPGREEDAHGLAGRLAQRHRAHLVSADGASTDDIVAGLLEGRWIATAESCTGGLLAARLTARPGSSGYVAGGVVSYSNDVKAHVLDVASTLIEQVGAVSPQVARAMADGARARTGADVAVAITGVAGPGGGTDAKPVGYVCLCLTTDDGVVLGREVTLRGDRALIRERSVDVAMHLIRVALSPGR